MGSELTNYVYVLRSLSHDKFYVGQTEDIKARLERHNRGYEKSTSPYRPWELVWVAPKENRSEAVALEMKLKNLSKIRLIEFMAKYEEGSSASTTFR